ncbi:MAG TPA: hypothetical protein VGJ63_05480 [Micromonosporaceae bacterium]
MSLRTADSRHEPVPARTTVARVARPAGRFLAHLAEMCAVMCLGAIALSLLIFGGVALLGYPDLADRLPALSTLVIAINLSVPMAVWMRYRGMDWRPTLEMSGATLVVGVLLIVAYWVGIVSESSLLGLQLQLACPVMIAVMLLRFRLYSGLAGHHAHDP